jgi:hypothetical protein
MSRLSTETLYQLAANGDARAAKEYEQRTAHLQEGPPIFLSGEEVSNPPAWAKGRLVTDGAKTWRA